MFSGSKIVVINLLNPLYITSKYFAAFAGGVI